MRERLASALLLLPALLAAWTLALDAARPARVLRYQERPAAAQAAAAGSAAWEAPLARLRGWSAAAGVERPGALLLLFAGGLAAAVAASIWLLLRREPAAPRPEGAGAPTRVL